MEFQALTKCLKWICMTCNFVKRGPRLTQQKADYEKITLSQKYCYQDCKWDLEL